MKTEFVRHQTSSKQYGRAWLSRIFAMGFMLAAGGMFCFYYFRHSTQDSLWPYFVADAALTVQVKKPFWTQTAPEWEAGFAWFEREAGWESDTVQQLKALQTREAAFVASGAPLDHEIFLVYTGHGQKLDALKSKLVVAQVAPRVFAVTDSVQALEWYQARQRTGVWDAKIEREYAGFSPIKVLAQNFNTSTPAFAPFPKQTLVKLRLKNGLWRLRAWFDDEFADALPPALAADARVTSRAETFEPFAGVRMSVRGIRLAVLEEFGIVNAFFNRRRISDLLPIEYRNFIESVDLDIIEGETGPLYRGRLVLRRNTSQGDAFRVIKSLLALKYPAEREMLLPDETTVAREQLNTLSQDITFVLLDKELELYRVAGAGSMLYFQFRDDAIIFSDSLWAYLPYHPVARLQQCLGRAPKPYALIRTRELMGLVSGFNLEMGDGSLGSYAVITQSSPDLLDGCML